MEWNTDFHNVSIGFVDRSAKIKTDKHLLDFLALPGTGSVELAKHILKEYKTAMKKPLDISVDSLAIEILAHAYIDQMSDALLKISGGSQGGVIKKAADALEEIRKHTDIIDCGEEAVDDNRHIWDSLVPYHKLIYLACGRGA